MSSDRGLVSRPRRWRVAIPAVVLLVLGALVAQGVGAALGIRSEPAAVPAEPAGTGAVPAAVAPPRWSAVAVPAGHRLAVAAAAVADAVRSTGAPRPTIGRRASGTSALTVRTGAAVGGGAEAYRLRRTGAGITLEAAGVTGAARGLYEVADRIRTGAPVVPPGDDGRSESPRLGLRLVDSGAVGLSDDPAAFATGTDYSLNSDVVGSALLPHAPWVDRTAVRRIAAQYRQLVDHALEQGYNGIVVPGFLEYLTLAGTGVYPAGDPHPARARAMVAAFGPVWRYAADMGMRVYLSTDMLAVSPPLERYLDRTFGGLDVANPRLWSVYRTGLAELFRVMPFASGLMIRVGEGGGAYRLAGWDYSSRLAVTTAAAVATMLRAFLATAGPLGRDIIFRSWTVGIGPVGDLHTDPRSYEQVLGGIDDPHLVVSTKYSAGDFYSHLPLNPTLSVGGQRRIVEIQARREFEGLGSLPDDLGSLDATALRTFLAANPHIEGVWVWTQTGGPLYAGPRTLYLRTGLWQMWDVNVYTAARLAVDPDADPAELTAAWVRGTLSGDPATARAIGAVYGMSRQAVTTGLYLRPYADRSVQALGLRPPPMMWIFEWDIVTGDSGALDSVYAVSRDRLETAVADGDRALALARRQRDLVAGTDPAGWRDPALRGGFLASLDFEVSLFATLGAYRTMVLRHVQWLDTGSATAKARWRTARARFVRARDAHLSRYGHDRADPAYNLTAADLGMARADRDVPMAWLARGLLAFVVLVLVLGALARRRPGMPGAAAVHALWLGATRPWRLAEAAPEPGRADRVLVVAVPAVVLALSRAALTWFAAPAHLLLTLGAWLLCALVLRFTVGRRDPFALWAALGGVTLARSGLLLLGLVRRGPGRYWFEFWTAPTARAVYVTVAFAAFCWVFVAVWLAVRPRVGRARLAGAVLLGVGAPLCVAGAAIAAYGLERFLTVWNDQLALLPWGLHRILGITVYLGIPTRLPIWVAAAGLLLVVAGTGLSLLDRRKRADPAQPAGAPA